MGMVSVSKLKIGDVIGTESRPLFVVTDGARMTGYGTVTVGLLAPDAAGEFGGESYGGRVTRREWLHGAEARVSVQGKPSASTPEGDKR